MVKKIERLTANAIIDAMVDGVAVVDPNGTVIQANKAFLKMFGFKSLDEVRGVIFTEFLSERDIPRALESFKKCLEIGVGINVEFAVKDASGREFPILLSGSVLKDKKGEFVGVVVVLKDITELKRVEEKIRQVAEEWETTFNSISDLVTIHDKDFKLVRANKACAETLKMKPEELIGKTCYEVFHGTKEPWPNCPHKQALETKKPAKAEFFEPRLGIHLDVSASPIFDEKSEVVGTVHITKDITERKRADEERAKAVATTTATIEGMIDVVGISDMEGRVIQINKAVGAFGYKREEVIGKPVVEFLAKRSMAKLEEERKKTLKTGVLGNLELIGIKKDGSEIPVLVNVTLMKDAEGKPIGRVFSFKDITELKRAEEALRGSEELYRTLVETMNEGLDIVDENGVIIYVNAKLCEMSGYSRDEMIGRPITDFLDESAQDVYEEQRVMRRKGERGSYELVRTRKDGQKIFTLVSAAPIFDEDGNFEGSFAVITDLAAILQATVSLMERMAS